MRVLIACERSGVVRRAFRAVGADAWSCDLEPADDGDAHHIRGDALAQLDGGWDLMICHPPCTHLAVSGARWFRDKRADGRQQAAVEFAVALWRAPIPRVCLEQPVSILSSYLGPCSQTIQPWQFGHGETKATCLWLRFLPRLVPTSIVSGRAARIHRMPPGPDRARLRSETYSGIAAAMAAQWGTSIATLTGAKR